MLGPAAVKPRESESVSRLQFDSLMTSLLVANLEYIFLSFTGICGIYVIMAMSATDRVRFKYKAIPGRLTIQSVPESPDSL